MLHALILDALSAIAYGEAFLFLGKWFLIVLTTVVLVAWLVLHLRRLDREPGKEARVGYKAARHMQGAPFFLWAMVAIMALSFGAFGTWFW